MKHFHLRSITAILFIFLTFFSVATIFITPSLSFTSSLSNTNSYPIGNAFGLDHIGPNDAPRVAQDGVSISRNDIYWSGAEQTLGVFNFTSNQEYVQGVEAYNISPDITLDYGNQNLYGPEYNDYVAPSQIPEWLNYINATIYAFQNDSIYWEMWNEPNADPSWMVNQSREDEFFNLMNITANFIYDHYPNQKMISPGTSEAAPDFDDQMIKYFGVANFNRLFMAISFHPYTLEADYLLPNLQAMQQLVKQDNYTGQLWITEIGYPVVSPTPDQLSVQADQLLKYYAQALSMNISRVEWYDDNDGDYGIEQRNSTTQQYQLRPSGITYALLSHLLPGGAFYPKAASYSVASGIDPDQLWSFPYLTSDNNLLYILWSSASAMSVTLNFGSNLKTIGGSPLTISQLIYDENTSVTLPLTVNDQGDSVYQMNLGLDPVVFELNLTQYKQALGLPTNTSLDQIPPVQISFAYPSGYILFLILIPAICAIGCIFIVIQIRRNRSKKAKNQ